MNTEPPLTPCIGVCKMDAEGFCIGCRRNSREISAWGQLSNLERAHIMRYELPKRIVRE